MPAGQESNPDDFWGLNKIDFFKLQVVSDERLEGGFFFYSEYSYIRTHKNTEVISLNWYNLSHEIIEKPKLKWVELLVHWTNLTVP